MYPGLVVIDKVILSYAVKGKLPGKDVNVAEVPDVRLFNVTELTSVTEAFTVTAALGTKSAVHV